MPGADEQLTVEARLLDFLTPAINKMVAEARMGLKKMGNEAKKQGNIFSRAFQGIKNSLLNFAKMFGPAMLLTVGLTKAFQAFGQAIDFVREKAIDFEKVMSKVKAIINPSIETFGKLSAEARRLGETTVFSATQAGEAFVEMGKLGFTAGEIMSSTADVLNVAAMSGANLAESAEVIVKTLNQYSLGAEDAKQLTDTMAKAFTTTALDIDKFRESMKFVGTSAHLAGLDIEETTAILGLMADNGLEASIAGTSLNQMLIQMVKPGSKAGRVFKELGVESESVLTKMKTLAAAGIPVGQVFELLDVRAGRAANVIFKNIGAMDELTDSLRNSEGEAQRMADTMLDNTAGATTILTSASEGLAIALGEAFNKDKRERIEEYTDEVREATKWVKDHQAELKTLSGIWDTIVTSAVNTASEAVTAFAHGLERVMRVIDKIKGSPQKLAEEVKSFNEAMTDPKALDRLLTLRLRYDELIKKQLEGGGKLSSMQKGILQQNIDSTKQQMGASFQEAKGAAITEKFLRTRIQQLKDVKVAQKGAADAVERRRVFLNAPTGDPADIPGKGGGKKKKKKVGESKEERKARLAAEAEAKLLLRTMEEEHTEFLSATAEGRIALLLEEEAKKKEILIRGKKSVTELEANTTKKIQAIKDEQLKKDDAMAKRQIANRMAVRQAWVGTAQTVVGATESIINTVIKGEQRQKQVAFVASIIQGALAIQKAVASAPPPANIPAVVATTALTLANTATIASQAFKKGGLPLGKNANIRVNEQGQEAVLNAGATARLGSGGVSRLNSGRGDTTTNEISYSPTITIGSNSGADVLEALQADKQGFADFIRDDLLNRGHLKLRTFKNSGAVLGE